MTDSKKVATDEQIAELKKTAKLPATIALIARIEQLQNAINLFGNNPNGFDWAVLDKIDQLERENERLRGLCGEAFDAIYLKNIYKDLSDKLDLASKGETK